MSSTIGTVRSTNYNLCTLCPKIQEKWVDIALVLGCIACLTIGAFAAAGHFHAIGTVNATHLSWVMYAGALVACIIEVAKIAVHSRDVGQTHSKNLSSDSVTTLTEFHDADPTVPQPNSFTNTAPDNPKTKQETDATILKDKKELSLHEAEPKNDSGPTVPQSNSFTNINPDTAKQEPNPETLQRKRKAFLDEAGSKKDLYLEGEEIKKVKYIIQGVQMLQTPEMFKAVLDQIRPHLKKYSVPPHIQLVRAIVHEVLGNPLLAAEAYIYLLSLGIKNEKTCIEKIQALIATECWQKNHQFLDFLENLDRSLLLKLGKCGDIFEKLLLQKDAVRMDFEKALLEIKAESKRRDQECFICFSLDSEVESWLSSTFVPDLSKIGLKPVYERWNLSHAMDLNNFREKIRHTDLALIVCTESLKKKCTERVKAITGCVQEVRIALERYNDDEKAGTLFTLLLHGKRQNCMPRPILEPIFAAKTEVLSSERETDLYDYYTNAFRIFASLVGMPIKDAEDLKEAFYAAASKKVLEREIESEVVRRWAEVRYKPKHVL